MDYLEAMMKDGGASKSSFYNICKKKHKIFLRFCHKKSLCSFETKRKWGYRNNDDNNNDDDNVNDLQFYSVPFGYDPL